MSYNPDYVATDYKIVVFLDGFDDVAAAQFGYKVKTAMMEGWEPLGGVTLSNTDRGIAYTQTMVKYKERPPQGRRMA